MIKPRPKRKRVGVLKPGTKFLYETTVSYPPRPVDTFVKLSRKIAEGRLDRNAVCLRTGDLWSFSDNDLVEVV